MMSKTRPDARRSRAGGRRHFLPASELGLAALALVLAVLVWAVVWGRISDETKKPIELRLDLRTSERFRAYHDGRVKLRLRGPNGQIEEARATLGTPPTVVVYLADLEPGLDNDLVTVSEDQFAFRFPRRLVTSVSDTKVEVYRWREHEVAFAKPDVHGVPEGFDYEVTLSPATSAVWGPAGKIGEVVRTGDATGPARRWTIHPDPLDVADLFPEKANEFVPPAAKRPLLFDDWRHDRRDRVYRSSVELPSVTATIRFFAVEDEPRMIRNRIAFEHPDGYVATPEDPNIAVGQGYYEGAFTGRKQDLDRLEREKDAWWFVVRIPDGELPDGAEPKPLNLPIEYFHSEDLDQLRVEFQRPDTLLVGVRKE